MGGPEAPPDRWGQGEVYEGYVGRWSRLVAREFIDGLAPRPRAAWLDVGCGTGALANAILESADPERVVGVDPAGGFVTYAGDRLGDPRARFVVGDARELPAPDQDFDYVVSGLVLNFVPDIPRGLAEMVRVTRGGGRIAAYVWDYAGDMQMMRLFWDAAIQLDPSAAELDEGRRFAICRPEPLEGAFRAAGLADVATRAIDVPTTFRDFDDLWRPFLSGQAPAPSYCASLTESRRSALKEALRARVPAPGSSGAIELKARAWAVSGLRP